MEMLLFDNSSAENFGQMHTEGRTPDGYSVNEDGQWVNENGEVQTRADRGYASSPAADGNGSSVSGGGSGNSGSSGGSIRGALEATVILEITVIPEITVILEITVIPGMTETRMAEMPEITETLKIQTSRRWFRW